MRQFTPTAEQYSIGQAAATRFPQHFAVDAAAGTGKSTTAKWLIANILPPQQSVQYCAFNKHNAAEFMDSLKTEWGVTRTNVSAKTFNAMGFKCMKDRYAEDKRDSISMEDDKYGKLVNLWVQTHFEGQARSGEEMDDIVEMLGKLVDMWMVNTTYRYSGSRELAIFGGLQDERPLYLPHNPEDRRVMELLAYRYRLRLSRKSDYYFADERAIFAAVPLILKFGWKMVDEFWSYEMVLAAMRGDWKLAELLPRNPKRTVTFNEQLYCSVVNDWRVAYQPYWVLVDEAQDISPLDRAMIDRYVWSKDGKVLGRVVIIGDPQQAIYAFRGADSKGFPNSRAFWNMQADPLTLSLTRRCPKVIVAAVQNHKPGFRATDDAPEGAILPVKEEDMIALIEPGHAVISRMRAPMLAIWRKLIAAKKPAIILGRDVSQQIIGILKKVEKHKGFTFPLLVDYLKAYERRKADHMTKAQRPADEIAAFLDQMEAVYGTVEGLQADSMEELITQIKAIFKPSDDDSPNVIKIMTGHGSKGLEFPVVWNITPDSFPFYHPAQTDEQREQEMNLWYVVMTRTKNIHYAVTPKDGKKKAADEQLPLPAAEWTVGQPTQGSFPAATLQNPAYQQQMLLEAKNSADEIGIDPDAGREITIHDVLADVHDQAQSAARSDDAFDEDTLGYIASQPGFRSMLDHLRDNRFNPPEPPELRKYYASSYPDTDEDAEQYLD